jgi:hypothetical protein
VVEDTHRNGFVTGPTGYVATVAKFLCHGIVTLTRQFSLADSWDSLSFNFTNLSIFDLNGAKR